MCVVVWDAYETIVVISGTLRLVAIGRTMIFVAALNARYIAYARRMALTFMLGLSR